MKFNLKFLKRSKKPIIYDESKVRDDFKFKNAFKILTINQRCGVRVWYELHKDHIDKMVSEAEKAYPPSLIEDKSNPMIWKAEYWKWYLESGLY
jgi:hypothetical protein